MASADVPPLEALDLSHNGIGDLGVQHLVEWPRLADLRDLDLSHNEIGDEGAVALASASPLAGLWRLALNGNRITEVGKRVLASSQHPAADQGDASARQLAGTTRGVPAVIPHP